MKNYFLVLSFCLSSFYISAQTTNTFPTSGSVGIGTTSPASKLDVIGPVSIGAGSVNTNNTKMFIRNPSGKTWAISSGLNLVNEVDFGIYNWTDNASSPLLNISSTGNVGIGLTNPGMKLDVNGDTRSTRFCSGVLTPFILDNFTYDTKLTYNYGISWVPDSWFTGGNTSWLSGWGGIKLFTAATPRLSITNSGNVLIGKTTQSNAAYILDVNGATRANKVVVNTTGADFVFDSSYCLKSLNQVENYISHNKHLPDIEPAAYMQKEGLDLGENQTKLLQKVEELTLYIIAQNKKIEALQSDIKEIKNKPLK